MIFFIIQHLNPFQQNTPRYLLANNQRLMHGSWKTFYFILSFASFSIMHFQPFRISFFEEYFVFPHLMVLCSRVRNLKL